MMWPISSSIQDTTKSSSTLANMGVRDIGLVSPSLDGFDDLGDGVMCESFHIDGMTVVKSDLLKIVTTGTANS